MNKWMIILVAVALAIGASSGAVFALADLGDNPPELDSQGSTDELHGDPEPIRSDEDIDPNVCNLIHNINACTPEELEELGWPPKPDPITAGESRPGGEGEVEGKPEPLFEDGEPQHEVQSYGEAVYQDGGSAGGTFWASSDGEFGCDMVQVLEDGGEGETQAQPPVIVPKLEVPPAEYNRP